MVKEEESTIQRWVDEVKKIIYPAQNIGGTKVGKASLGITLPIDLVRKLRWRDRQRVIVTLKGKKLIIEDWKK